VGSNCGEEEEVNYNNCGEEEKARCKYGTCIREGDGGQMMRCDCIVGYEGESCVEEVAVNQCTSLSCLNGATCVELDSGYECQCVPGTSG